jgi:hypothetical protein
LFWWQKDAHRGGEFFFPLESKTWNVQRVKKS